MVIEFLTNFNKFSSLCKVLIMNQLASRLYAVLFSWTAGLIFGSIILLIGDRLFLSALAFITFIVWTKEITPVAGELIKEIVSDMDYGQFKSEVILSISIMIAICVICALLSFSLLKLMLMTGWYIFGRMIYLVIEDCHSQKSNNDLIDLPAFSPQLQSRVSKQQSKVSHDDLDVGLSIYRMSKKLSDYGFVASNKGLKPALDIMSPDTGLIFSNITKRSYKVYQEIYNLLSNTSFGYKNFNKELMLLERILDTFVISTVNNCKLAFTNSENNQKLKSSFEQKFEPKIIQQITEYELQIDEIEQAIDNVRLNEFELLQNNFIVEDIMELHRHIVEASGDQTNKHLVISNRIINQFVPSLMKTLRDAENSDQKQTVCHQLEQLKTFFENQLSLLKSGSVEQSSNSVNLLQINCGDGYSSSVGLQIKRNSYYLNMLQDAW